MEKIISYLKQFKGNQGIYIIRPNDKELLKNICDKLSFTYSSDIAYIGKAGITKSSDLYKRAKQEMGWSNFDGATFVRKMGIYLDFNIKDKRNKALRKETKLFICKNFYIECISCNEKFDVLEIETEFIKQNKPCLNVLKNSVVEK